jgi:regulator of RNase E activity RraA
VGDQPAGKVLVLASSGYTNISMGAGNKLVRLEEHGLAGGLTDERLRDFEELAGYHSLPTARARRRTGVATS